MNFKIYNKLRYTRGNMFHPNNSFISKTFIMEHFNRIHINLLREISCFLGNKRQSSFQTKEYIRKFLDETEWSNIDIEQLLLKNTFNKDEICTNLRNQKNHEKNMMFLKMASF